MKWLLISAVVAAAFASCKKEKINQPLIGKWELRYLKGGMVAPGEMFYPAGNGTTISFGGSTYESWWMNQFVYRGTYTKTTDYAYATGRQMNAFVIDNSKTSYEFSVDTLVLYLGMIAADGVIEKYVPVH